MCDTDSTVGHEQMLCNIRMFVHLTVGFCYQTFVLNYAQIMLKFYVKFAINATNV